MTQETPLTHPQKVSMVAGLEFGVTAKKKLLGLSSDTGEGVCHHFSIAISILDALDVLNVMLALVRVSLIYIIFLLLLHFSYFLPFLYFI